MNKTRQHELIQWLKKQSTPARPWLRLSMLLGLLGGLLMIAQAGLLATLLQSLIIDHLPRHLLVTDLCWLLVVFVLRAIVSWCRERTSFVCGMRIRLLIRNRVLEKLAQLGPYWVRGKPAGSWTTIIIEQIEDMQDYYSRYLPQIYLSALIPLLILLAVFPINWVAGLILLITAPLIPLFMVLVGMGAADANRRNFVALARLSGKFLDSLRGLDTLRLFYRAQAETKQIVETSEHFRRRTMEVLRLAFLSSAVLEFFAAVSIALVAVYFGFSYLGVLHFGNYHTEGVTLFSGFFLLLLAPEFFQPLRDLGTFYHAKAQALGAAESLVTFLTSEAEVAIEQGDKKLSGNTPIRLVANELEILAVNGTRLAGPLNFTVLAGQRIAIVGHSGAGKSSLLHLLLGFLPYRGSLKVEGIELRELNTEAWRHQVSWIGQNPYLPEKTLRANILLSQPNASNVQLQQAIDRAYINEFLVDLPEGLETEIGDHASRLSVGQAQRVAVARALLNPCRLLLLDEPSASLDMHSEQRVMNALSRASYAQTTLLVTHQLENICDYDLIWVMDRGMLLQQGDYSTLCQTTGAFASLLSYRSKEG